MFYILSWGFCSSILTFAAYELAIHFDIQDKLYNEISAMNEQIGGRKISYEELHKLKYLDQIVCETLRKWTALPQTDHVCTSDFVYDDGDIKLHFNKGDSILISIHGLHNDEKYFLDANTFNPDRFSAQNKSSIVSGTYLPFGTGPTNCIGKLRKIDCFSHEF